jgi:SAM-dependent methyltransferase
MTGPKSTGLGLWRRLSRFKVSEGKISRPIIRRFVKQYASSETTLILHPEEGLEHFPNRYVVSKRPRDEPDLVVDTAFQGLSAIAPESYGLIVCIGLLEHIPDPHRFVGELHRILRPGGRAILTCSCCFSLHEGPEDYFHYTPFGIRVLFGNWSGFEVLRGSCGPFTTIGILIQRILLQSEVFPPLRPCLEVMAHAFPVLDRFVTRQYFSRRMEVDTECDSMLPSNLQIVAIK